MVSFVLNLVTQFVILWRFPLNVLKSSKAELIKILGVLFQVESTRLDSESLIPGRIYKVRFWESYLHINPAPLRLNLYISIKQTLNLLLNTK